MSADEAREQEKQTEESPSNRAFAEMRKKNRELQDRLEELEARQERASLGIEDESDPVLKNVAKAIRDVKAEIGDLAMKVYADPDDAELEPFMQKAIDEFPEFEDLPRTKKLEKYKRIARALRAEANSNTEAKGGAETRRARAEAAARATLSGGGFPPTGQGMRESNEDRLKKFREALSNAKTSSEKRKLLDEFTKSVGESEDVWR